MPATAAKPRVLLLKLGAIGDCIMAIPAAHLLHQSGHEIDWVCGETVAPVLRLYPWINVLAIDDRKLLSGHIPTLLSLWRLITNYRYDLCATLYYDARYKVLALPVRARRKLMLSKLDRALQLLPGRHHTDEYARILTGRPDDVTPTQLSPIPAPNLPAPPLPHTAKPRIVLAPGGARNSLRDDELRRWPVESYAAVAETLLARGCEVLLIGGPGDSWVSAAFSHLAVTDLIAKHSLPETLALLDSADVTITHDAGPLHLAGITRTGIVTIFGPTDPRGRLPQRANTVALWGGEGFACRPCYDGRNYAACTNNACVQQITPHMVLTETETLLTAQREGRPLLPRVRTPKHTPLLRENSASSANSAFVSLSTEHKA